MKVSLTDICDFQGGTQPPKDEWIDQPAQGYVRMLQIRDFTQSDKNYIEYVKDTGKLKTCIEDDILIGRYGASIGKILTGLAGAYNVAIVKTIPDEKVVSKKYLYWYLNSQYFQRFISNVGSRAAQAGFNKNDLGAAQIPLVDKERQEEICEVLEKANKLISLRKQQLAKLDELVEARFVEMFGDPVNNPMNYPKSQLGKVCDVRDGTHDSPEYYDVGYPLVTSKNVTGGKIDLSECNLISEDDYKKICERSKVDRGDIIMPMIGTVGKPVIVNTEPMFAIKNVALIKFTSDSLVTNIYIKTLLESDYFDCAVLDKIRGGTQKFIALGDIRKLEIILPDLKHQQCFSAFVERVDQQKQTVQQSLEKLELMKKALMQEYFG